MVSKRSLAKWIMLLAFTVALLPASAFGDSLITMKVDVEPAFPLPGQEIHLRMRVEDKSGGVLSNAKVVAIAWMETRDNPGMPAMAGDGVSRAVPVRMVGQPLDEAGKYLVSIRLPMSGRWRIQVWANSGAATGKVPLELAVLSSAPPSDINWPVVSGVIALAVLLFLGIRWLRARPASAGAGSAGVIDEALLPANLLRQRWLRSLFQSRWYPLAIQIPIAAVFAFAVLFLLAGSPAAHDNFGSAVTWVLWWSLLPLLFLLFGRIWCAVCPMAALSDLVQRLGGRNGKVPLAMKRWGVWLIFAAFLFVTWFDAAYGLASSARNTGYLLLLVTTGVVAAGILFERRAWCRYLCFIGGLSGNYAMASVIELRATPDLCRQCKTIDCYRGNEKAPGCPMFEYPRMIDSNRCCNLCAHCIKACPHDSIRLSVRQPTTEVSFLKRGRWEEALLAAALLAIVATQTFIMLSPWVALTEWARWALGSADSRLVYTIFFAFGLLSSFVGLFLISAVSGWLRGDSAKANLLRYAYALIPLGLMGHLAHNLNHLLSEGKALFQSLLRLFGQPDFSSAALVSAASIQILQIALVIMGAFMALCVVWRLSMQQRGKRAHWIAGIPHALLVVAVAGLFLWMFGQGMVPRMQMTGEAHEEVSTAQIEAAKASVRAFVDRNLALTYVHLEEHGYQDIILRNGNNYYFVDITNNMVVSSFTAQSNLGAVARVPYGDAARTALMFALAHYPNLVRYGLQSVAVDETSPYTGG
ncbi:MAG: 4Fe-4S binding protein [Dehalococcoidia bacterium]|nr:4Fe-4S binding protein [Dehalococcoidia bacterium]